MKLQLFIQSQHAAILDEWIKFARSISPGARLDEAALRDHAPDILEAVVSDMATSQTGAQRVAKSKGDRPSDPSGDELDRVSALHAAARLGYGFNVLEVVSEYRALRASVLALWRDQLPVLDASDLEDTTRFNEAIDELITKAVACFTRKVDQARDMFLAILSHDLRNPLTSISMSAQLMPRVSTNATQSKKLSDQIANNATTMAKMISDLLDYTRTRLGTGMPMKPMPMDLRDLCSELFDEFRTAHAERDIRLSAEKPCVGVWDVDRLRQAISNLMGNAIQHGAHETPVTLTLVADAADAVVVKVHNGGPPISAGDLPRIFDPLVRGADADGPKASRPGSIGLGLYIAREVARSHGGRIDVTSTAATGTTFAIWLPRDAPIRDAEPVMDEEQIKNM